MIPGEDMRVTMVAEVCSSSWAMLPWKKVSLPR